MFAYYDYGRHGGAHGWCLAEGSPDNKWKQVNVVGPACDCDDPYHEEELWTLAAEDTLILGVWLPYLSIRGDQVYVLVEAITIEVPGSIRQLAEGGDGNRANQQLSKLLGVPVVAVWDGDDDSVVASVWPAHVDATRPCGVIEEAAGCLFFTPYHDPASFGRPADVGGGRR